ncbi:hypothetical protein [Pseudoalteromonas luteoviolacea]|nr:hypothetical protein [Pseudoalteromonas luteoviolacea]TQF71513.1 hypothetical protein FLM44_10650 [Pseudoalteromonas luteoviolacea]
MTMLIAAILLYILAVAICLTVIVKGHDLNSIEKKIKKLIARDSADSEQVITKKDYYQAYEIVDDLGTVLECNNDMVKYDGVKSVFRRVEEFRSQKQPLSKRDTDEVEQECQADKKKKGLWVVK